MKTKPEMDPAAAFPDAKPPGEAALKVALADTAAPIEAMLAKLRIAQPAVAAEWHFSPRSGWHQIYLLKNRRLFYLVPKHGDVRVSLILGGKAVAMLKEGPFARQTTALLKTANRYPEGTAFSFDRQTLEPDLLLAFLAAKIAY